MKSRIIMGRGTSAQEKEIGYPNWAGAVFREYQEKRMGKAGIKTKILLRRGTGSLETSEYPKPKTGLPLKGRIISTSRGTSIRTL